MASPRGLDALRKFTKCDVSQIENPYGGFFDDIKMYSPGATGCVFGPAITVQMVEMSDIASPKLDKHFYLGAEAVIVDGRMRDVNEHRAFVFPVFARGNSVLRSNSFTRASRVNVPLQLKNDLWINPGDLVIGHEDGVVVTSPPLIEQVVALCQKRAEIGEKTFAGLRNGEAMGPLIKSLRKEK
ncbi:ribonuclease E inhibitor RraA/Dimethylmenaquinone methyltransferase [Truncatella angustata]|uniref:Ribonuclease E inhibitor RraA/Dimethylmenaquinone methyltransferase n=1 Tax=Truncatella angustata TaxID=152316 RepID=A0A9P8UP24_9PEZI|nr:ribonuclease E inhibitor RraA/Dimethylmenaquinone methyltransferase [Truncatella angustata]KAH6655511.1 ribonuclease E inhibitor RraA/Dimethylmenaquinone methyltransferase [Truncatella angustata]